MTKTESAPARVGNIAWRGAIEFAGFPVNVALYSRVKKQRNESFRTIAPSGQPMKQGGPVDSKTGKPYDPAESRKGVEVGKGQFAILTEDAIEAINSGVKTKVAVAAQFPPVSEIDLSLALDRFAVRPDDTVPGAERSVNTIWNGLRSTGRAYVSQISVSGGMDSVLALWADDAGFWGALLPFTGELYPLPDFEFTADAKAEALFETVVGDDERLVDEFDHSAFTSEYKARRADAIAKAISGQKIEAAAPVEQKSTAPDLMAVLEAAASGAKPKAKAKPRARKPVAA